MHGKGSSLYAISVWLRGYIINILIVLSFYVYCAFELNLTFIEIKINIYLVTSSFIRHI